MTVLSILDRLSVLGQCGGLKMKSAKFFQLPSCNHRLPKRWEKGGLA